MCEANPPGRLFVTPLAGRGKGHCYWVRTVPVPTPLLLSGTMRKEDSRCESRQPYRDARPWHTHRPTVARGHWWTRSSASASSSIDKQQRVIIPLPARIWLLLCSTDMAKACWPGLEGRGSKREKEQEKIKLFPFRLSRSGSCALHIHLHPCVGNDHPELGHQCKTSDPLLSSVHISFFGA